MKELLKNLINARPTPDKGELACANVAADFLNEHKITCQIDTWDQNRANLTARIASANLKPALIFAAHLDVVPQGNTKWQYPPYDAVEEQGKIFGRGSADMKAGLTAILTAITRIAKKNLELKGDLILLAAAGEETDSCGVKRFIEKNASTLPPLAGAIIPEPTNFQIVTAHRGILWLEITTIGKSAHGSMPQNGINAIRSMNTLLNALDNYQPPHTPDPLLGKSSMSINKITGGNATNIIPDRCSIQIDIRTLPNQDSETLTADFQSLLEKLTAENKNFKAELNLLRSVNALQTDVDCDFVKKVMNTTEIDQTQVVGFTTDAPFLAELNAPVVIFGPGNPNICHKPNEFIEIADLEKAAQIYEKIITQFLT